MSNWHDTIARGAKERVGKSWLESLTQESQPFDFVQEIYLVHLVYKAAKNILPVSDDQPFSVSLRYSDNSKEVTVKSFFTVPRE